MDTGKQVSSAASTLSPGRLVRRLVVAVGLPQYSPGSDEAAGGLSIAPESETTSRPTPAQAPLRRVLIIEDHHDLREALVEILVLEGYEVSAAADGEQALGEARLRRPDLILLDLMMPVMNGWQFRAEQAKDPDLAPIPVVVMSAFDTEEIEAAALLPKPFQMDDMLDTVRRLAA